MYKTQRSDTAYYYLSSPFLFISSSPLELHHQTVVPLPLQKVEPHKPRISNSASQGATGLLQQCVFTSPRLFLQDVFIPSGMNDFLLASVLLLISASSILTTTQLPVNSTWPASLGWTPLPCPSQRSWSLIVPDSNTLLVPPLKRLFQISIATPTRRPVCRTICLPWAPCALGAHLPCGTWTKTGSCLWTC